MQFTGMSEFLIYGLLFVAIVGFNLLKQILAARREQQRRKNQSAQGRQPTMRKQTEAPDARQPSAAHRPAPPAARPSAPVETQWGRSPDQVSAPAPRAGPLIALPQEETLATEQQQQRRERKVAAQQSAAIRKGTRRRLFRHRGELRHAIVLMTALGPCRALQPYDQEQR